MEKMSGYLFSAGTLALAGALVAYLTATANLVVSSQTVIVGRGGILSMSRIQSWPLPGRIGTMLAWNAEVFLLLAMTAGAIAAGRGPFSNMYEFSVAFAVGVAVIVAVALIGPRLGVHSIGGLGDGLRVGEAAPQFEIEALDGNSLVSLDQPDGKPVWLTFWASWCPPCRVEMPDLNEVVSPVQGREFNYLAVSFGEEPEFAREYMRKTGYDLPVGVDPNAEVAINYGVMGLPTHIFIDSEGVVTDIYSDVLKRGQIDKLVADLW